MRRIGRTTRRLTLLREYRRGRCRVRFRCRSSRDAVEMPRFGAGNHESMSRRRGGPRGAGSEAQRGGVAARAQSGWGRGWGGREFGCGRTQRRCAGVIDAAGLAHGEMGEDCLDDRASSLRERHFRGVSMHAMTRNVPPHTPQCSTSMWKTRLSRCIQLMGAGRVAWGSRAV